MARLALFWRFVTGSISVVSRGNILYYAWIALLFLAIAAGAACRGFLLHPDVRIRGRSEALDVFALPLEGEPGDSGHLSVVG